MDIVLYSGVDKRINSTKRPTGAGTTFSGVLKDGCSVLTPVVLIEAGNLSGYNYALISSFGRYYYITDIVSINNLWEVHMKVDPMSSNRDLIGALSVYVERADADFDGEVMDNLYPGKTTLEAQDIPISTGWFRTGISGGMFVLGIIDKTGGSQVGGAVTYYGFTPAQLRTLMAYLLSDTFLSDNGFAATMTATQIITQSIAKTIVKPMDYITSCVWFPFAMDGTSSSVTIGYWDLGNTFGATKINEYVRAEPITGTIPAHPQAATRGNYLNHAPFTEILLRLPPFGVIPINPDYFVAGALTGYAYIDCFNGKAHLQVILDGKIVAESTAMLGVPIQISQITPDFLGIIDAGIKTVGSQGQAGDLFSTIGNSLASMGVQTASEGVNGSFINNIISPMVSVKHGILVDEDRAELGRPLCQVRTVNTLPGYIKCAAVPDTIPRTQAEKDEITSMMLGGFFFE